LKTTLLLLGTLTLAAIFVQDFRSREVSVYLFAILFFLGSAYHIQQSGFAEFTQQITINYLILVVQFGLLLLYLLASRGKIYNPINKSLGIGDIVFFLSIVTWFKVEAFILVYTISLVFSLMVWYLIKFYWSVRFNTVPLAGLASVFFLIVFILEMFLDNEMSITSGSFVYDLQ
jgi:hypothetical protein